MELLLISLVTPPPMGWGDMALEPYARKRDCRAGKEVAEKILESRRQYDSARIFTSCTVIAVITNDVCRINEGSIESGSIFARCITRCTILVKIPDVPTSLLMSLHAVQRGHRLSCAFEVWRGSCWRMAHKASMHSFTQRLLEH